MKYFMIRFPIFWYDSSCTISSPRFHPKRCCTFNILLLSKITGEPSVTFSGPHFFFTVHLWVQLFSLQILRISPDFDETKKYILIQF